MYIKIEPDTRTKLALMGDATQHEPVGDSPHQERTRRRVPSQTPRLEDCIAHVSTPTGKMPVMKAMITTACERNCNYCIFRAGRGKTRRMTFKPEEIASALDQLHRSKQVDGLFLSSGIIKGSVTTQDKLLDTVDIVRRKYQYQGYVHLKIMPGIEKDQLHRAMQLANRISVNLEGATEQRLNALAPKKDYYRELLQMLQWAEELRQQYPQQRLASSVTQFVVGAVGDTDLELLSVSDRLYHQLKLKRVYYSAFNPVPYTPFENLLPVEAIREYRLYQSSFLLRDYAWDVEELSFLPSGNLRTDMDPKRAWAEEHLRHAPINLMTANRHNLLRVPGIGPKSADVILRARRKGVLTELSHLRQLGIRAPEQSAPYILLGNGQRPLHQMRLF